MGTYLHDYLFEVIKCTCAHSAALACVSHTV